MSADTGRATLHLNVDWHGGLPRNHEEVFLALREDLRDACPAIAISPVAAAAPPTAKAADPVSLGAVLLSLAASGGVLTSVIAAIQSWVSRQEGHSVTLEMGGDKIEIKGAADAEQARLISLWIKRHDSPAAQ